jgi:membrane fusion protein, multidrug efflux system
MKTITQTSLSLVLALLVAACGGSEKKSKKDQLAELNTQMKELKTQIATLEKELGSNDSSKKEAAKFVAVMPVTKEIFKTYIDLQGKVDAEENVTLNAQIPGMVTAIYVKPGQSVSAGTVLAETDNKAMLSSLSALQTSLELTQNLFEKQKALWDQNIGTEVQYLQLKAQKEGLEKQVVAMQSQLKMTKIVSPIGGTVDAVDLKVGGFSSPGIPIGIRVVNFNKLKVKAEVAEGYISKIKVGDQVDVELKDISAVFNAKVGYASRAINALTRTFDIEANLPSNNAIRPNMVAKIKVNEYTSATPVVVLPVSYVQKDESNQAFVLLSENNKVVKRNVKTGKKYNGKTEIVEGLKDSDQLITEGFESLEEGDFIKTEVKK